MPEQTRLTQVALYVTPQQRAELKALSKRTRVPQQEYLREAVADVLKKYRKEEGK
jgi:DNA-directed RNA polymerase subunit F